jgi:hypothetical protein
MREFAVTDAIPQKNCAPTTIRSMNVASPLLVASKKICAGAAMLPVESSWNAAAAS